jgi:hypothetical protein
MGQPAGGGVDNIIFVGRKGGLNEGLGDITLLWGAGFGDGDGEERAEFELGENWGEAIAFGPVVGIEVAKDDEAIFESDGIAFFIFLEGGDGHGREGIADDWTNKFVLVFGEDIPGVEIAKAEDFLLVGGIPIYSIIGRSLGVSLLWRRRVAGAVRTSSLAAKSCGK